MSPPGDAAGQLRGLAACQPAAAGLELSTLLARLHVRMTHHLGASEYETMAVSDLPPMADEEDAARRQGLRLSYTEPLGSPWLRDTIAGRYSGIGLDGLVCSPALWRAVCRFTRPVAPRRPCNRRRAGLPVHGDAGARPGRRDRRPAECRARLSAGHRGVGRGDPAQHSRRVHQLSQKPHWQAVGAGAVTGPGRFVPPPRHLAGERRGVSPDGARPDPAPMSAACPSACCPRRTACRACGSAGWPARFCNLPPLHPNAPSVVGGCAGTGGPHSA